MRTSTVVWIVVILIILLGGWYWWSSQNPSMTPTGTTASSTAGINGSPDQGNMGASSTTATPQQPSTTGNTATPVLAASQNATLGQFLTASNGMTLYRYTKDTTNKSNCTGACAQTWPPYTISSTSALSALPIALTGTIGSITRADGSIQVTYNGKPLYFYVQDSAAGDVKGQNVGGVWFVVKP